ncbi:general stress protein [Glycomyces terrestris]|uniref:general stress protein n=1 Tax=Glycomyces terrestris TaxID=2493553 RepID=UPI0018D56CF7|nr:general stress protein [Glycomyces terrestris]
MSRHHEGSAEGFAGAGQVLVGTYADYAGAERAVDHLSDSGFPVERTAIVGRGLTTVERVTGRMTMAGAAGQGAVSGALLGAVLGWLFGLFNWVDPLIAGLLLALYGALLGAIAGAIVGLVAHALTGGRRDFSSVGELRADSYDLLVDAAHATEAGRLLDADGGPGRGPALTAEPRVPAADRNETDVDRELLNEDRPDYERVEDERTARPSEERRRA